MGKPNTFISVFLSHAGKCYWKAKPVKGRACPVCVSCYAQWEVGETAFEEKPIPKGLRFGKWLGEVITSKGIIYLRYTGDWIEKGQDGPAFDPKTVGYYRDILWMHEGGCHRSGLPIEGECCQHCTRVLALLRKKDHEKVLQDLYDSKLHPRLSFEESYEKDSGSIRTDRRVVGTYNEFGKFTRFLVYRGSWAPPLGQGPGQDIPEFDR